MGGEMKKYFTTTSLVALGALFCIYLLIPCSAGAVDQCAELPDPEQIVRTKVVISDLHLGPGYVSKDKYDPLEDFRFDDTFNNFLTTIGTHGPIDLIIAGDFIDFWQILARLSKEEGSTEQQSLAKLRLVLERHKNTFDILGRFIKRGHRLILVPGNHDVDLQWPEVQKELRARLGADSGQIFFAIPCYESHGLHVEHGHQYDYANRFSRADSPMVDSPTGKRLEVNWGSVFVSSFYNQVEKEKPFIDNLSPSLAAVWWALRSEPARTFGLPQIGKLLVMLLRDQRALDNLGYLATTLGDEDATDNEPARPQTVEGLIGLYGAADPSLGKEVETLLKNPEAKKDAEVALAEVPKEEWQSIQLRKEDPTLRYLLTSTNPYINASRQIISQHPGIRVVVMGHTHELDARVTPLNNVGGSEKWYVNTGCWQKNLLVKDARKKWGWKKLDLDNHEMFPERFSYVKIEFDQKGQVKPPTRDFWPPSKQQTAPR
jgi:UDP-2,3-diacylglucosamine pyrophosphatase LpxH